MLIADKLTKWYGPTLAVDTLSLELEPGKIVGFLGPNGAGKSTTIRMLTGYLPPTTGRATLDGHDVLTQPAAARRKLGYLPESNPLYPEMRVDEYLNFAGKLQGMDRSARRSRTDYVTDRCGLTQLRRRTIGRLSKGNKQRVGLAAALLHDPPMLVLDEPTSGLDPQQISQVRQLIRELGGEHTVLLSSHILPEVQRIADRVVIIARGKIVADGTVEDLHHQSQTQDGRTMIHLEVRGDAQVVRAALNPIDGVERIAIDSSAGGPWTTAAVLVRGARDLRVPIAEALAEGDLLVRELRRESTSLEEFFVRVTDAPTAEAAAS